MGLELFGRGRIARDVLGLLLGISGQELHTREIARRVSADAHPVQRALEQFMSAGLVQSRRLGNLRLWSVAPDSPLLPSVRDLVRRTSGIAERLRHALAQMPGVRLALLFGSYASGRDRPGSDIDLFIVGAVDWQRLTEVATPLTREFVREVNPVIWAIEDVGHPNPAQAKFLSNILGKPRIWLVGDDHELERNRASVGAPVVRATPAQASSSGRRRRPVATAAR